MQYVNNILQNSTLEIYVNYMNHYHPNKFNTKFIKRDILKAMNWNKIRETYSTTHPKNFCNPKYMQSNLNYQ